MATQQQAFEEMQARIAKALEIAPDHAYDGDHHTDWVVDQMVRALCGCPMVPASAIDASGNEYHFEVQSENDEYLAFRSRVSEWWATGVAP